ncbi:hypothetical protein ID866_4845 [Astraeus odoratus]|nr:hypothetical protein ID866_4845 [Astraeus odoratus]
MEDLNLAAILYFSMLAFQDDQQHFLDASLAEQQAIEACLDLGEKAPVRGKKSSNSREENEALLLGAECKKNKTKFALIPDVEISMEAIILLFQVALWKLQQHKFYDDLLLFLPSADGTTSLVSTSLAQDKANVIEDELL